MRQFAALAISGLVTMTALTGCFGDGAQRTSTPGTKKSDNTLIDERAAEYIPTPQDTSTMAPAEKCYYDLCTNVAKEVPNIVLTITKAATPSEAQKKYYQTYVEPVVLKLAKAHQMRAQVTLQTYENQEGRFLNAELSQVQQRIIRFGMVLKNSKPYPTLVKYWNEEYAKLDFVRAFQTFNLIGKYSYFQKLYPKVENSDAVFQELQLIQSFSQQFSTDMGMKVVQVDPAVVDKIMKKQTLSVDEVEAFSATSNSARMFKHYIYEKGSEALDAVIKEKPLSNSDLFDLYKNSSVKTSLRSVGSKTPEMPQECQAHFYQSINLYPQQQEVDRFKALTEKVRAAALSQLDPNDPAAIRLQNLKVVVPPTAEENTKSYLRALNTKYNEMVSQTEEMKNLSDATAFTVAIFQSLFSVSEAPGCSDIPDAGISDKTTPADGFLLVSWFSVRYPQVGASILAHEMGHTVFAYGKNIQAARQCLIEKQNYNDLYANEDYADYFAGKVNIALGNSYNIRTLNYGCALVMNPSRGSIVNPDDKDPHSADLYRTIQMALNAGKQLPPSCEEAAQSTNPGATRSCQ